LSDSIRPPLKLSEPVAATVGKREVAEADVAVPNARQVGGEIEQALGNEVFLSELGWCPRV